MRDEGGHGSTRTRWSSIGRVVLSLGVAALFLWSFVSRNFLEDPASPSTHDAAVSAMETLPSISCRDTTSSQERACTWGPWTLTLAADTGTVWESCRGEDQHVVFGGSNWLLTLRPAEGSRALPPLTDDEYEQLTDVFNFGNGSNWQAC